MSIPDESQLAVDASIKEENISKNLSELKIREEVVPVYYRPPLADHEFNEIIEDVKSAILSGIQPIRISQGSSGSYFVRNQMGKIVGVFKPKNEEPYGKLNPKWTKWLHRHCCPCFFGRSCLMPNVGYISEAAASVVDRHFQLNIVPRTEIVKLSSSAFYYSFYDKRKQSPLPEKIGSFQIYLEGFKDASVLLPTIQETSSVNEKLRVQFQHNFERLVILDYIIRNTDRGNDNWMVYYGKPDEERSVIKKSVRPNSASSKTPLLHSEEESPGAIKSLSDVNSAASWELIDSPIIQIAGIDNGLAFPFKHPDNWRTYPYGWINLPQSRVPFSYETCNEFLPILSNPQSWDDLICKLKSIFLQDSEFSETIFNRQMAILRGQLHNLCEVLETGGTPLDLVKKSLLMIEEEEDYYKHREDDDELNGVLNVKRKLKTFVKAQPCFSWC